MLATLVLLIRRALLLIWLAVGLWAFSAVAGGLAVGLAMAGNEASPIVAIISIGLTGLIAFCWWKLSKWLASKVG